MQTNESQEHRLLTSGMILFIFKVIYIPELAQFFKVRYLYVIIFLDC
jgi:hypothetical protein